MNNYNLDALNILLVDDNSHMHKIVKAILHAMRINEIRSCIDAADAFTEIKNLCPDLIITDWVMQPLDGLEFTRLVRKSTTPYVPIILLTGHADKRVVVAARDAGVNEILSKPISIKTLHTRIVSIIDNPRPFVKNKTYIGPCRRRSQDPNYDGPERRLQA